MFHVQADVVKETAFSVLPERSFQNFLLGPPRGLLGRR